MKIVNINQAASILGVALFVVAGSAGAGPITFNTNSAGTEFLSTGNLTLFSSGGAVASLKFIPNAGNTTGVPSTVNLGDFLLSCPTCTTQALGGGAFFNPFTFDLVVTDITDNAQGTFVVTSLGGTVFSNVSGITINISPLQLGPGTGAWTGNFNSTTFTTTSFTGIPAPNSGTPPGDVTIQGFVNSPGAISGVPEPATFGMIGGALIGLGMLRRRKAPRT